MNIYQRTRRLTLAEAAYIAGLIDGEGTITLSRRHANERRQLVISIANTERQLLEYVKQSAGVGKITGKRVTSARHTPSYSYSVSNRQALALLAQVQAFLRSYKRDRAALTLACYVNVTSRNGRYSSPLGAARARFEEAFFEIQPNLDADPDWGGCLSGQMPGET